MSVKHKPSYIAFKIAAIYAVFGCLWILLSDKLLLILIQDLNTVNRIQTYKGWFYVLVTAILVYMLINQSFRSQQNSYAKYQRLLNNIKDSIYLADSQGNIIDANRSACENLGYSRKELLTLKIDEIDPNTNMQEWSKFVSSTETDNTFSLESSHKRKDGSLFPTEISAFIFDENEKRFCLGVARDISIRKKAQELLIQNEKMNSLGELAAGIAHEINNPLSAIIGAAQNIYNRIFTDSSKNILAAEENSISLESMRNYLIGRDIKRMLNSISESGLRSSKIVRNMLNFSRKETNQLCVCNIESLLDDTIDLISNDYNLNKEYDFKQIIITRDYKKDVPNVCCISNEIQLVFLNVLKNATEAMMEKKYINGTQPELILRLDIEDSFLIVIIEDNGPGMIEETQEKVFEPFYTLKKAGKGTGLGLSISHFIITDLHHGKMSVTSIKNVGTQFAIALPIRTKENCP